MMGVFFLSNAAGNKIAGWAAGFLGAMPIATLFGTVAAITLGASVVLFLLVPWIKKLMGGVSNQVQQVAQAAGVTGQAGRIGPAGPRVDDDL